MRLVGAQSKSASTSRRGHIFWQRCDDKLDRVPQDHVSLPALKRTLPDALRVHCEIPFLKECRGFGQG